MTAIGSIIWSTPSGTPWDAVHSATGIEIDDAIRAELRRLAIACGGWITREMDDSFSLVPLSEWQDRFVARFDLVAMDTPVAPPGEMGGKD